MTSDVARARPLSPGSGKGQRLRWTPGRSAAHAWWRSVTSSVPTWLELGVWLARLQEAPGGHEVRRVPLASSTPHPPWILMRRGPSRSRRAARPAAQFRSRAKPLRSFRWLGRRPL